MNAALKVAEIEGDLRVLCVEYKQYVEMKIAAERAIMLLRALLANPIHAQSHTAAVEVLKTEAMYRPFLLACASKNAKLVLFSLNCVQKLLMVEAMTPETLSAVIGMLKLQAEGNDEGVLLKVIQTLLLAIAPQRVVALIEEAALCQALNLCFILHCNENPVLSNTANAALRQVVSLLFDRVFVAGSFEESRKSFVVQIPISTAKNFDVETLEKEQKSAYLMFKDLCTLCSGDNALYDAFWLKLPCVLPITVGLELMETILAQHCKLFSQHPFRDLLQYSVCPLIIKHLSEKAISFPLLVRLMRLVLVLIKQYHKVLLPHCEIMLSLLLKFLAQERGISANTLSLEVIRALTLHSDLFFYFFCLFDEHELLHSETLIEIVDENNMEKRARAKIIGVLCHGLSNFILTHQSRLDDGVDEKQKTQSKAMSTLLRWQHHHKSKYLDSLNEKDNVAVFDDLYAISLAIDSLFYIVQSLASLINRSPENSSLHLPPIVIETSEFKTIEMNCTSPSLRMVHAFASVVAAPLLTTLIALLNRSEEESQIQHFLTSFQSFTNTCGVVRLENFRNAFLNSLAEFATPNNAAPLSGKNIQAFKAIFNVAQYLGGLLGSYWNDILHSLMVLNKYIIKHYTRPSGSPFVICSSINDDEILILMSAMNRLFDASKYFEAGDLEMLLRTISTLSLSMLADLSMDGDSFETVTVIPPWMNTFLPRVNEPGSVFALKPTALLALVPNHFCLIRLIHVAELNLCANPCIWDLVVNNLTAVATHRLPLLRSFAVQVLMRFMIQLLNQPPADQENYIRVLAEKSNATGNLSYQERLFLPFADWMLVKYEDLREVIINSISQILQTAGPQLKDGWKTILAILAPAAKSNEVGTINTGFRCVQLIVNDFLLNLPFLSIESLIDCIVLYALQRKDTNMSFSAIGLLRDISGFLVRLGNEDSKQAWQSKTNIPKYTLTQKFQLRVFLALKDLSYDSRSEVRNSAIQVLFGSILNAQSLFLASKSTILVDGMQLRNSFSIWFSELQVPAEQIDALVDNQIFIWSEIWNFVISPLVENILMHGTVIQQKNSESATDIALGVDKNTGKSVKMLSHHSRSTAQQQWDESIVHSVNGFSKLMRSAVVWWLYSCDLIENQNSLIVFLAAMNTCISTGSKEVSLAAVSAVSDVLSSPFVVQLFILYPVLWTDVLLFFAKFREIIAIEVADTDEAKKSSKLPNFDLIAALVSLLQSVSIKMVSKMQSDQLLGIIETCFDLGRYFCKNMDAAAIATSKYRLTPIHQNILQFIEELFSVEQILNSDSVSVACLSFLLDCASLGVLSSDQSRMFILPKLSERAWCLFLLLFKSQISVSCKIQLVEATCIVIVETVSSKFPRISAFAKLFFPCMNELLVLILDTIKDLESHSDSIFECVYLICAAQLSPSFSNHVIRSAICEEYSCEVNQELEKLASHQFQLTFLELFSRSILPRLWNAPIRSQISFLNLLDGTSFLHPSCSNVLLLRAMISNLFSLSSCEVPSHLADTWKSVIKKLSIEEMDGCPGQSFARKFYYIHLARLAFPILLNFVQNFLGTYVLNAEQLKNQTILEFSEFLLEKLVVTEISPLVFADSLTDEVQSSDYLLKLFPILCECITVQHSKIADAIKHIFKRICTKLHLER